MQEIVPGMKKIVFLSPVIKRSAFSLIILSLLWVSCKSAGGRTTTVVKPKYHHWWFDRKKDKGAKRTKLVKMRN
jgi:hypothetical protein